MRTLVAALTALMMLSGPIKADIVSEVLGCWDDPCIVAYNGGGDIKLFKEVAEAIQKGARKKLIIAGKCMSACTIVMDMVRDKTCVTPLAKLGFHRGFGPSLKFINDIPLYPYTQWEYIDIPYSPKVQRWINGRGGLPAKGKFIYMDVAIARTIWKTCSMNEVFQAHGLY